MKIYGRPFCCYCKRELRPAHPVGPLSATRDHLHARAFGGKRWVPCCYTCNQLKGSIDLEDWWWIVRNVPRYWRAFRTTVEVRQAIRAERVRRASEYARINQEPGREAASP